MHHQWFDRATAVWLAGKFTLHLEEETILNNDICSTYGIQQRNLLVNYKLMLQLSFSFASYISWRLSSLESGFILAHAWHDHGHMNQAARDVSEDVRSDIDKLNVVLQRLDCFRRTRMQHDSFALGTCKAVNNVLPITWDSLSVSSHCQLML